MSELQLGAIDVVATEQLLHVEEVATCIPGVQRRELALGELVPLDDRDLFRHDRPAVWMLHAPWDGQVRHLPLR